MPRPVPIFVWFVLAPLVSAFSLTWTQAAAQSGAAPPAAAAQASGSAYRALRSVSGSNGHEENGRYVMDDARSVFVAGKDAKVIVYFEWEGPVGPHHFEGLWKSPEGRIVLISDFRYEATKPRFSGYWSMLLSDATPPGEWAIDARIDGEFAGTHSFVITSSGTPPPAAPPARQPLSTPALYKQALDASVFVEKLATDGSVLDRSSGFWVGEGRVLTAFEAIDGATTLRLVLPDGSQRSIDQVLGWSRWQDWAVVSGPGAPRPFLKRGAASSPNVGDHCVFLEMDSSGAQLADGTIIGKTSPARAGERLLLTSAASASTTGGALLDEYGDYVGVVGGAVAPGGSASKMLALLNEDPFRKGSAVTNAGAMAVPASLIPESTTQTKATSLAELASRGEFLPQVRKSEILSFATLAGSIQKGAERLPYPQDYRQVFSHRDGKAGVFVNWRSPAKAKGTIMLKVFDVDNHPVDESKATSLSLAKGAFATTSWEISLVNLAPGFYRVDVLFDDQTVWRDFFRVTD